MHNDQEELPVIKRGEYHLLEQYKFLVIMEDIWFGMSSSSAAKLTADQLQYVQSLFGVTVKS